MLTLLTMVALMTLQPVETPPLQGALVSRGYSWILDRTGDGFAVYQQVGEACWPDPDSEVLRSTFALELPGAGNLIRLTQDEDQATVYSFDSLEALPWACLNPDRSDRAAVVAIADLMATRYPGFEARGVDFEARRTSILALLPEHPTSTEAFAAAKNLLADLDDAHLELSAEIGGGEQDLVTTEGPTLDSVHRRGGEHPERAWLGSWRTNIQDTVLGGQGHLAANNRILWGRRDGVGYLMVITMGGFDPEDDRATGPLDDALDAAIADFATADAVIIDVSNNRGGYDAIGLRIAGRFADQSRVAYLKKGWGSGVAYQNVEVRPSQRPRYLGPVWLLTSDITVSAGETFTQAMLALPNVTQAGTGTRGAFSDQTPAPMANGWRFAMPMEIYVNPQGQPLEGRGLAPKERIELYPTDNLDNGHALAVLDLMSRLRASATPTLSPFNRPLHEGQNP